MTVAIGLVCSDGAIVAADSMGSSGAIAQQATKVYALERVPVVWTASGPQYVIEEVETALADLEALADANTEVMNNFTSPKLDQVRQNLGEYVRKATKVAYENALPLGAKQLVAVEGAPKHIFSTDFLFAGYSNGTSYLLEIAGDGQINWHNSERFYAVGSGGEFATVVRAVMAHYIEGDEPLTIEDGLRFAYRAIETTCRVSSSGVGLPVQLAAIDSQGTRILTRGQDEWEGVREGVNGWVVLERDTIGMSRPQVEEKDLEEPPTFSEKGD